MIPTTESGRLFPGGYLKFDVGLGEASVVVP